MRRWFAGLLLVALGWLASPAAVPVYDGVGAPDEPYKYAGRTPAPATSSITVSAAGGATSNLQLQSSESGPQVLIDLGAGAFSSPAAKVTLTATPLAPEGRPPRGSFDGNLYRVLVTGPAALQPDAAQGFLFLRAAVMTKPDPVIVHRDSPSAPWAQVQTTRVGRDNLSTPFRALGDYAVVRLPGAKPLGSGGLSTTRLVLLCGGVLLLLTITVLVLRRPTTDEDG